MNGWYPHQDYIDKSLPPYIQCGEVKPTALNCSHTHPCLFNIEQDPCEYTDVSEQQPQLAEFLYDRITQFARSAQPPRNKPIDPAAYPMYHNGHWTDWKDKHPIVEESS